MRKLTSLFLPIFLLASAFGAFAKEYNILDFGAKKSHTELSTIAIQTAIDAASADGGGTVVIPAGEYVTGTLFLKSNVTLYIGNGTVLRGSTNQADYPANVHKNMYRGETTKDRCLIYAENAHSIAIEGHGTIDGNGSLDNFPRNKVNGVQYQRPMLIRLKDCTNITFRDIHLLNPASWTCAFLYCDQIVVDGISIESRANFNGDGLDFDGCANVRVSNSYFDNSDDCICLQTSLPDKPCRFVTITNCNFTTKWAGVRIGLLSRGNIEFVTISNCTFRDIEDSGLKIQLNEGGEMRHLVFCNLVMENVPRPVFITFCQQIACVEVPEGEYEPLKRMHDMAFSNMIIDNSKGDKNSAFFMTGIPSHQIENISLNNITFIVSGGGSSADAAQTKVKEFTLGNLKRWPEFYEVGSLPAFGLYARHLNGLFINDFKIITANEDKRSAIVFDKVDNLDTEGLYLNGKKLGDNQIRIISL